MGCFWLHLNAFRFQQKLPGRLFSDSSQSAMRIASGLFSLTSATHQAEAKNAQIEQTSSDQVMEIAKEVLRSIKEGDLKGNMEKIVNVIAELVRRIVDSTLNIARSAC